MFLLNIKLMNECKIIEYVYNYWINIEILNKTSWIKLMLTLNTNIKFELKKVLMNQNKQELNFAKYQQPHATQQLSSASI